MLKTAFPPFILLFSTWVPANLVLEKEEGVSKRDVQKPNNVSLWNPKIITVFTEAPHCNPTWATHMHMLSLQRLFFMYGSGPVEEQWTEWVTHPACVQSVFLNWSWSSDVKGTATLLLWAVMAVLKYANSQVSGSFRHVLSPCSYKGLDLYSVPVVRSDLGEGCGT